MAQMSARIQSKSARVMYRDHMRFRASAQGQPASGGNKGGLRGDLGHGVGTRKDREKRAGKDGAAREPGRISNGGGEERLRCKGCLRGIQKGSGSSVASGSGGDGVCVKGKAQCSVMAPMGMGGRALRQGGIQQWEPRRLLLE
ncbi:condensin-2 complex subunit G2 [Platysternon megacephalum]|uniref:Condensin-2 complex subunit G2 n=1 Tax=Platysternon megacephalum TaxID=55544 RepID=A0A4D9EQZ7_9SAUR|nr:condensin-2 complex subunit G2 [Platysternon megacephalum]